MTVAGFIIIAQSPFMGYWIAAHITHWLNPGVVYPWQRFAHSYVYLLLVLMTIAEFIIYVVNADIFNAVLAFQSLIALRISDCRRCDDDDDRPPRRRRLRHLLRAWMRPHPAPVTI